MVIPGKLFAGFGGDIDKRLDCHDAADRPETEVRQGLVAADAQACSGFAVFDLNVVVCGAGAETLKAGSDAILFLEGLEIQEAVAVGFGEKRIGRAGGLDLKRQGYDQIRTHSGVIDA